jgi:hypothetical protein
MLKQSVGLSLGLGLGLGLFLGLTLGLCLIFGLGVILDLGDVYETNTKNC